MCIISLMTKCVGILFLRSEADPCHQLAHNTSASAMAFHNLGRCLRITGHFHGNWQIVGALAEDFREFDAANIAAVECVRSAYRLIGAMPTTAGIQPDSAASCSPTVTEAPDTSPTPPFTWHRRIVSAWSRQSWSSGCRQLALQQKTIRLDMLAHRDRFDYRSTSRPSRKATGDMPKWSLNAREKWLRLLNPTL